MIKNIKNNNFPHIMTSLLNEKYGYFKEHLKRNNLEGLCLDIDDTIAATNIFWAEHHIKEFGNPEKLSAEEIIDKYDFASNVPYWNRIPEAEEWIENNCNEIMGRYDVKPIGDALIHISQLENKISFVAYLTGRSEKIEEGTKKWLKKHKFPELEIFSLPDTQFLNKIGANNTSDWKMKFLEFMHPYIKGLIDDNTDIIKSIPETYDGKIYLYNNKIKNIKQNIISCYSWSDVERNILNDLYRIKNKTE